MYIGRALRRSFFIGTIFLFAECVEKRFFMIELCGLAYSWDILKGIFERGCVILKSEILSQEGNVVVVRADYEGGEVDRAVAEVFRDYSQNANIKGFRKGHVPRKTIEMFFGRSAMYKESVERLSQKAFDSIVEEYDLDLVTRPKFDAPDLKEGSGYSITFTFEVRPEVTLPDLSTLEAEKVVYTVKDEDIDQELARILEMNADYKPTDEDRPATKDDAVEVEYTTYKIDGDKKEEVEKNKKSLLILSTLRSDISEAVIGHKLAEEFLFDIKLEDNYPDPRLAGANIRYEMEILQFMKRVVPEESDETIERLSKGVYKTVADIKAELRRQMEEGAAARSDASLRESALEALAAASTVEVPTTMIERQYDAMRREESGMIQHDLGQSLEEYLEKNDLKIAEFEADLKKRAEQIVKNTLVLDALTKRDEISFTSEDMSAEIIRLATNMRMNPQELADRISKNREDFSAVSNRVLTQNTLKHLAESVKVKEIDPPAEDAEKKEDK